MNWRIKTGLLLLLGIPAFTGVWLNRYPISIVDGISYAWMAYLFSVHLAIRVLLGGSVHGKISAVTSIIAIPIVFGGALVSWIFLLFSSPRLLVVPPDGPHYAKLCVTMLTVVPLALSLVAAFPFGALEQKMLIHSRGITPIRRTGLMILRVFNHIAFYVIPNILEVMREEQILQQWAMPDSHANGPKSRRPGRVKQFKHRVAFLMGFLISMAIEGICSAVQNIPLWAYEIAQLPDRRPGKDRDRR
ncbi:MAG: hypothetical protein HKM93_12005 [Desulfobacteraceae bacterium]|nr:hypothetical protein [Desulfobacteraceae bacterium]